MGQGPPPHLSLVDGERRDGRERERSTYHDAREAAPTIEEGDGIPGGDAYGESEGGGDWIDITVVKTVAY